MDRLDENSPNIDTMSMYHIEYDQVMKVQGKDFKYSLGDYVVKMLLGSTNKIYDKLDEIKLNSDELKIYYGAENDKININVNNNVDNIVNINGQSKKKYNTIADEVYAYYNRY